MTCQIRQLEAKANGTAMAVMEDVASAAVEATAWEESKVAMEAAPRGLEVTERSSVMVAVVVSKALAEAGARGVVGAPVGVR